MKIALLSFEYPAETGFGGIGTYAWYQARALAKLGHEVDVIAGATEPTPLRCSSHDGVRVYRYRYGGKPLSLLSAALDAGKLWWTKNRLENAVSMCIAMKIVTKNESYDIIEMPECGAEGLFVNLFCPGRRIVRFHSPSQLIMRFYDVVRADIFLTSFLERLAIGRAHHYTSCSQFLAGQVATRMALRAPIKVIANGIDLDLFDAEATIDIRGRYGIPEDDLMIFFAGRMEKRKGIHICREIVTEVLVKHKVSFVFAGQDLFGYMKEVLLPAWADPALAGSVHYLGKLDQTEIRACLRTADIFLMPSLWENCPYSCLEAMAAKTAVVCTNQGGMPEIIDHRQNGLLAVAEDPRDFISCIEMLLGDADLRQRLAKAGRTTIEKRFADMVIAREAEQFYQSIIAEVQPR